MIRFDHIAIAVPRMAEAPAVLVGVLGGVPGAGGPSGVYRWGHWRFKDGARLEVLEPTRPDGFLQRFLATRGPGIHHVTFKVESLGEACQRARAHGYTIVGYDDSDPAWAQAFLHPKEAQGIVVQLAESHGTGGAPRRWQPPPGPPDPPPAVRVLGLRLRAQSRQEADRLWATVLGGTPTPAADGEIVYRWPGSPMRIRVVVVEAAGAEGPLSIDVASARRLDLPAGPHPVLGATFVQRAGEEA